jgi:hypothetical protein
MTDLGFIRALGTFGTNVSKDSQSYKMFAFEANSGYNRFKI